MNVVTIAFKAKSLDDILSKIGRFMKSNKFELVNLKTEETPDEDSPAEKPAETK